jgi:cytochrome c biogenesis protein CcdA
VQYDLEESKTGDRFVTLRRRAHQWLFELNVEIDRGDDDTSVSLSITPLALVPLMTLLAGPRPYRTVAALFAGLYISYFGMGLAFVFGLGRVFDRLNAWASHRWHHPEPIDFVFELVLGLVLVFFGLRIAERRKAKQEGKQLAQGVSPAAAFGFGFMLNVVGFPGAVPFFAAADQILRADPPPLTIVVLVAVYVAVFLVPLGLVVLLRALLGARGDGVLAAVKGFFDTWGRRVILVLMLILGLLMTVDAALYFLRGAPLVPIGWPAG